MPPYPPGIGALRSPLTRVGNLLSLALSLELHILMSAYRKSPMVMTIRDICWPIPGLLLAGLLAGCALAPEPAAEADTRLDELIAKVDLSLDRQASAEEQLLEQGQQLALQKEQLASMSEELGLALGEPAQRSCPEVAACPERESDSGKMMVGRLEEIWLTGIEIPITVRIDTGLRTSSLDVQNVETFERDGQPWVRFEIIDPRSGEALQVERKQRRTLGVVQNGGSESKRPVVKMGILIGDIREKAEFALSERTHESYQAQIGRSVLSDVMVVDVSRKHIAPYVLPEEAVAGAGATQ